MVAHGRGPAAARSGGAVCRALVLAAYALPCLAAASGSGSGSGSGIGAPPWPTGTCKLVSDSDIKLFCRAIRNPASHEVLMTEAEIAELPSSVKAAFPQIDTIRGGNKGDLTRAAFFPNRTVAALDSMVRLLCRATCPRPAQGMTQCMMHAEHHPAIDLGHHDYLWPIFFLIFSMLFSATARSIISRYGLPVPYTVFLLLAGFLIGSLIAFTKTQVRAQPHASAPRAIRA